MTKSKTKQILHEATKKALVAADTGEPTDLPVWIPPAIRGKEPAIIKDLPVKGSSLVVKQGTAVRGIRLTNNPLHISGKAAGTNMVIIAAYCKKM